jgi:hypothetical protein
MILCFYRQDAENFKEKHKIIDVLFFSFFSWGVLENYWNGEILDSKEKVLGMARSMTYNGINPIVTLVEGEYIAGVKLDKAEMVSYEKKIIREPNLEKWFVTIPKKNILPCAQI